MSRTDKYDIRDVEEEVVDDGKEINVLEREDSSDNGNSKKRKSESKPKHHYFDVALDTEYVPKIKKSYSASDLDKVTTEDLIVRDNYDSEDEKQDYENPDYTYLSIQLDFKGKIGDKSIDFKVLVINAYYEDQVQYQELEEFSEKEHVHYFFDNLFETDICFVTKYFLLILHKVYQYDLSDCNFLHSFKFNLFFFFTLTDLTIAFGYDNMLPYYTGNKKQISRKRNYTGNIVFIDKLLYFDFDNNKLVSSPEFRFDISLNDLSAIDVGGLETIMSSCGLDTSKKNLLDDCKAQMDLALINRTGIFCEYSIQDASVLHQILEIKIASYNTIITDIYKIEDKKALFTKFNFPLTLGSIVHRMFIVWYKYKIHKNDPIHLLAHAKQSILDKQSGTYGRDIDIFEQLKACNFITGLRELIDKSETTEDNVMLFLKSKKTFIITPTEYASKKFLLNTSIDSTLPYCALTSGGRTVNEQPEKCSGKKGGDADQKGAYGKGLKKSHLPIGRPRYICNTSNQSPTMKFGKFIYKIAPKTNYNLWKVIVNGNLSFNQDLLFSKVIGTQSITNRINNYDEHNVRTFEIPGTFALLRKELRNAPITNSLWEI